MSVDAHGNIHGPSGLFAGTVRSPSDVTLGADEPLLSIDQRAPQVTRSLALGVVGFHESALVRPRGTSVSVAADGKTLVNACARMGAGNAECTRDHEDDAESSCMHCELDVGLDELQRAGFELVEDVEDDGDQTYRNFTFAVQDPAKAALLRAVEGNAELDHLVVLSQHPDLVEELNAAVEQNLVGRWRDVGLPDDQIAGWSAVAGRPDAAVAMRANGWRVDVPDDDLRHPKAWATNDLRLAAAFRDAGLKPDDLREWRSIESDPQVVLRYRRERISADDVRGADRLGAKDVDERAAFARWLRQGSKQARETFVAVRRTDGDRVRSWVNGGGSPNGYIAWAGSPAPADVAVRYDRLGFDASTANWLAGGSTVDQVAAVVNRHRLTRDEVARFAKFGTKNMERLQSWGAALTLAGSDRDEVARTFVDGAGVSEYVAARIAGVAHGEALAEVASNARVSKTLRSERDLRRPVLKRATQRTPAQYGVAPTIWR